MALGRHGSRNGNDSRVSELIEHVNGNYTVKIGDENYYLRYSPDINRQFVPTVLKIITLVFVIIYTYSESSREYIFWVTVFIALINILLNARESLLETFRIPGTTANHTPIKYIRPNKYINNVCKILGFSHFTRIPLSRNRETV